MASPPRTSVRQWPLGGQTLAVVQRSPFRQWLGRRTTGRRLSSLGVLGLTGMIFSPTGLLASVPQGVNPQAPWSGAVPVSPVPASGPASSAPLPLSVTEVYNDLYVLGPGDGLQLTFTDPSAVAIGGPVVILPDGTSTLSLLGSVQLTGLTIGQATRWLTSLYAKQLVRPELILSLTSPGPSRSPSSVRLVARVFIPCPPIPPRFPPSRRPAV